MLPFPEDLLMEMLTGELDALVTFESGKVLGIFPEGSCILGDMNNPLAPVRPQPKVEAD